MNPRPIIFISAVTSELKSARQLVANTLQFLGYEPVWQDIFGTEQGDLRAILRQKIDESHGLIQILGKRYGAEPPTPDPTFGRVSYTQYEALYAQKQNKKIWYLVLTPGFPTDAAPAEPDELTALQKKYCDALAGKVLYHTVENPSAMEASVLKLRNDLSTLRRGVRRWAVAVSIILLLLLAQGTWLFIRQFRISHSIEHIETLLAQDRPVVQAVLQQTAQPQAPGQTLTPEKALDQKIETVARDQHLPPDEVRAKLKSFIDIVQNDPHADPMDKLRAAVVNHRDDEAITLGQQIGAKAEKDFEDASAPDQSAQREAARSRGFEAFLLVGQAYYAQKRHPEASDAFQRALALADPEKNLLDWCSAQQWLAIILAQDHDYAQAEEKIRPVIDARSSALGRDDPLTLGSRFLLVIALERQHKLPQAEAEARPLLYAQEKLLGPENDDTLETRAFLAIILADSHQDAEAETQLRALLPIRLRTLPPDDSTILNLQNLLVVVLQRQNKHDEAEQTARDLLAAKTKALGPENSDTLDTQALFAAILATNHKYAEAEAQTRSVIAARQHLLGPTHPDTLSMRFLLVSIMVQNDEFTDAAKEDLALLADQERVLGPDHADTINSLRLLPLILFHLEKFPDAAARQKDLLDRELRAHTASDADLVADYGNLIWFQLINHDYPAALDSAAAAMKYPDPPLALQANYAHALLFTGDFDAAKKIYTAHMNEKLDNGMAWEESILHDFDDLENHGATSPDTPRIRALLTAAAP